MTEANGLLPTFPLGDKMEFLRGGPNSRINGEISHSVDNDLFKKSVVFNFGLMMKEVLSALLLYIDGHFMQISTSQLI